MTSDLLGCGQIDRQTSFASNPQFESKELPYVARVAVVVTEVLGCKRVVFEDVGIPVVKN